ncbi:MAG: PA2169 family four-helix-bundle protein [Thermoanaerobaculia bacterium]|nr:PA2169 family four-helix-bundle protein [Thermoanaerobaculia bacterium]
MTDEMDVRPSVDETRGLNALLRAELAAVNAYQRALRSAENRATVDSAEILSFAAEHQRTVAALQGAVRDLGGIPESEAATWGAFALLSATATARELLSGEEAGLQMYEAASGILDGDARELITLEIIPRQRRHVAELREIIRRLST